MKKTSGGNGNSVGNPDTKGAAGARVSNRAVVAKSVSSSGLSRMNPDAKQVKGGKC